MMKRFLMPVLILALIASAIAEEAGKNKSGYEPQQGFGGPAISFSAAPVVENVFANWFK